VHDCVEGAVDEVVRPQVAGYQIAKDSELIDDEPALRAILDTVLRRDDGQGEYRRLTDHLQAELIDLAVGKLGYDLAVNTDGDQLVLHLKPFTLVRRVNVEKNFPVTFTTFFDPIREADIANRLSFRPGARIPTDENERASRFHSDEGLVVEYLAHQGFFDATVHITTRSAGPHAVTLEVTVDSGRPFDVGDVTAQGSGQIREEDIVKLMRHTWFFGWFRSRFSFDRMNADVEELKARYQALGFVGVRIAPPIPIPDKRDHTVSLVLQIQDGKRIDVAFTGNKAFSDDDLKKILPFAADGASDAAELERAERVIRTHYQQRGFYDVVVTSDVEPLVPNWDRVRFTIDEGPQLSVSSVTLVGNRSIASIPGITQPGSGGSDTYATSAQIDDDQRVILTAYAAQGFAHTTVRTSVAPHPAVQDLTGALAAEVAAGKGDGLHIVYTIVEGPRDVVDDVSFVVDGEKDLTSPLAAEVVVKAGAPFVPDNLDDDVERIKRWYRARAHLYATADVHATEDPPHHFHIVFAMHPDAAVKLGHVLVRGNFKTKSWIVRDVLDYQPGDQATTAHLEAGQQRLRATDLFSGVRPPVLIGHDRANMILTVDEKYDRLLDFEPRAGYSSEASVFGAVDFYFRNLLGSGINVITGTEIGVYLQRAYATISFPTFLVNRIGIPLRLDLAGHIQNRDTAEFGQLQTWDLSAALSRQFTPSFFFSAKYTIRHFQFNEDLVRPPGATASPTVPVPIQTGEVSLAFIYDGRRDSGGRLNPLTPSHGVFLSGSAAFATPAFGGDDTFVKFSAEGQFLFPIGKRVIVTNTLRYDQGVPLGASPVLPPVELFFAGGDTTVRGFEEDHMKTTVIREPVIPGSTIDTIHVIPVGGNVRAIHNLDLQFELVNRGAFSIASALFLDSGTVVDSVAGFQVSDVRQSLGIAFLRAVTPFGNISFEYAFPLAPRVGDDPTGRFHFNFGVPL
jgi:outer membrane protein assembly complex protein YaeT